ncbi:hypothetical protein K438DRAFT_1762403 [Mycena galopus ATCC 62051]|nr:hypothetical protein K438DRAFT_1762403 [Mycena galopus ATCC 62051]
MMVPKLREVTHGYNFDPSRFVIRDVTRWINLGEESPANPWFYNKCLQASNTKDKDKTRVFKRLNTSFAVALVLSASEWDGYLDYVATMETQEELFPGSENTDFEQYSRVNRFDRTGRLSPSDWRDGTLDKYGSRNNAPSLRPSTPPASKKRSFPQNVYVSPDRTRLRKVLAVNGASDISQAHNETQGTRFFTYDPAHAAQGSILVEFLTNIGIGTFKSARIGRLSLIHLPAQGLGIVRNELVAVKRMYRRRAQNPNTGN